VLEVEPVVGPLVGVRIGGCEPSVGWVTGAIVFDGAVVLPEGDIVVELVCATANAEPPSSNAPIIATVLSLVMMNSFLLSCSTRKRDSNASGAGAVPHRHNLVATR
jgi:hypothetical protein